MRVISFASGKGGVGRTTLVANLGVALSKLGKKTLLLDGCFETPDLALHFKLEKAFYTLNDALAGDAPLSNVIQTGPEKVGIAPAALTLDQIKKTKPERLPEVVKEIDRKTDFVLIDTPGGLRRDTVAALRSSTEAVLVTTPDMVAVSDCMKTKLIVEFLGIRLRGFVVNRVTGAEFELKTREIQEILNVPLLGFIPEDDQISESIRKGVPIVSYDPASPAAQAITKIAKKLVRT
jgi:septum site-determining protein MinD